ncbi:uncharacterized protein [Panulirus ornatus]|uniref:uncharacterized protein isoform X2 n=1 Tax=Panulirus ornatus TaxID=150431 RepID=UPI003A8C1BB3
MFGSVWRLSLRREPGRQPWLVLVWCWQTQLVMWSSLVCTGGLGRGLAADVSGTDDLVMGAKFGPGYSLLCSQGPPEAAAAAAAGGPSAASSRPEKSHSAHDRHTSNLTSFTFCAFLRIRKSRTHSPLLTYTQKTWSATVGAVFSRR